MRLELAPNEFVDVILPNGREDPHVVRVSHGVSPDGEHYIALNGTSPETWLEGDGPGTYFPREGVIG